MTHKGYIKRMTPDNFKSQNRGGKGIKGMQTIEEDFIEDLVMTTTHHFIMFFTNFGRVYRLKVYQIPEASRTARGTAMVNLLQLQPGEHVSAVVNVRKDIDPEATFVFMTTKNGTVKKTQLSEFANIRKAGLAAINIHENDELIEVKLTDGSKDILLVTKLGMCVRFNENDVRDMGRGASGVRGITLSEGDEVVGMQTSTQGDKMLIVSEKGLGKRTLMTEFKAQHRGGKGIRCYKITEKTGNVVGAKAVNDENEVMLINTAGIIIRMAVSDISVSGRNTSGVKLMDTSDGEIIAQIAKVREDGRQRDDSEEIE